MKVVAFVGSPRQDGNTARLVGEFARAAREAGHEVKVVDVYRSEIRGCVHCNACKESAESICAQEDDFTRLLPDLKEADCLVFGTPVYVGHVSGPLKCALDRFYCFLAADFTIRDIPGKAFATVIVSGAPAHAFPEVNGWFDKWMGEMMKMKRLGSVLAGGMEGPDTVDEGHEAMRQARELAAALG